MGGDTKGAYSPPSNIFWRSLGLCEGGMQMASRSLILMVDFLLLFFIVLTHRHQTIDKVDRQ